MNFTEQIEKRKILLLSGVLLITFSALLVTSLRGPTALDSFWHLQMGKDWLENGLSPWIDHYSFTFNGHNIVTPPVFFQSLLHLSVAQFGFYSGYVILRSGFFILTLGAVVLLLKQMKASTLIYALVIPMIVLLLQLRSTVRPELLSYTFSVLALMLYFRAGNRISTPKLLPMVALMFVWSNYHSSIVGYVIFCGFFVDCAIAQIKSRASVSVWSSWLAWGLLIIAVGFINPSFASPLLRALTFSPEWKELIAEYSSPSAVLSLLPGLYVLLLYFSLIPVLVVRQRKFGFLVIWLVLGFAALTMRRMVTPSGIVIVMVFAHLLAGSNLIDRLSQASNRFLANIPALVLVISIGATLFSNVERARFYMSVNMTVVTRYPDSIADYLRDSKESGRIFNSFPMGGYLLYRLSPEFKVYIDSRTWILYPVDHLRHYIRVANTKNPEVLRAELDEYSIDYIIWGYAQGKHDLVQEMGGFGLEFVADRHVLYIRGDSNFRLTGSLMSFPECWHAGMFQDLALERQTMTEILPRDSGLVPFADFVVNYSDPEGGRAFLDESIESGSWDDEMRRFAGFRLLESGDFNLATNLFGGIGRQKPKDYLASGFAMLEVEDYDLASQILQEFAVIPWPRVRPDENYMYYQLYRLLESRKGLTPLEHHRVEELSKSLTGLGYPDLDSGQELDINSFCAISGNPDEESVFTSNEHR